MIERGYNEGQLAIVKGLQGGRHYTLNQWDSSGGKLKTCCHKSISPNYRSLGDVSCLDCKRILKRSKQKGKQ